MTQVAHAACSLPPSEYSGSVVELELQVLDIENDALHVDFDGFGADFDSLNSIVLAPEAWKGKVYDVYFQGEPEHEGMILTQGSTYVLTREVPDCIPDLWLLLHVVEAAQR